MLANLKSVGGRALMALARVAAKARTCGPLPEPRVLRVHGDRNRSADASAERMDVADLWRCRITVEPCGRIVEGFITSRYHAASNGVTCHRRSRAGAHGRNRQVEYRSFIAEIVGRANAHRSKAIEAGRATLGELPAIRTADYEPVSVNIT